MPRQQNRRAFCGNVVAAGSLLSSLNVPSMVHAQRSDEIRIGLIGCGGRGLGATAKLLSIPGTRLVAIGDVFDTRVNHASQVLKEKYPDQVDVTGDTTFIGFDAYQKVIDTDVDAIVHATPPGFRPEHYEAIVRAGKHAFLEKPVATDAPGIRRMLVAGKEAEQRGLVTVVGFQRRYSSNYRSSIDRIKNGVIGAIESIDLEWFSQGVWFRHRTQTQSELKYQVNNWYYFTWLSGDLLVELSSHNIDVGLWALGELPISATAKGGRLSRPAQTQIYDHFEVEYRFSSGVQMTARCRQQSNQPPSIKEFAKGVKGSFEIGTRYTIGNDDPTLLASDPDAFAAEQQAFIDAVRGKGKPINDVEWASHSTLAAIMGRTAAYRNEEITWDEILASSDTFVPQSTSQLKLAPTQPNKLGDYEIPAQPIL